MVQTFGRHSSETERRSVHASCSMRMLCCASPADGHIDRRVRQEDTGVAQTSAVRGEDGVALERGLEKSNDADMVQTFDAPCVMGGAAREANSNSAWMRQGICCSCIGDTWHSEQLHEERGQP